MAITIPRNPDMYVCLIFRFNISCSPLGGPHQRRTAPILRVENPENPKDADQDSLHSECTIDSRLESAYFSQRREPRSRHPYGSKGGLAFQTELRPKRWTRCLPCARIAHRGSLSLSS